MRVLGLRRKTSEMFLLATFWERKKKVLSIRILMRFIIRKGMEEKRRLKVDWSWSLGLTRRWYRVWLSYRFLWFWLLVDDLELQRLIVISIRLMIRLLLFRKIMRFLIRKSSFRWSLHSILNCIFSSIRSVSELLLELGICLTRIGNFGIIFSGRKIFF